MDPQAYVLGLIVLGLPALSGSIYLLTKPVVKLIMHKRELAAGTQAESATLAAQDARIGQLEGDLAAMREEMDRLHAVEGFYQQLRAPAAPEALPPAS